MIEISQITSAKYTYNSYNGEKGSIQVSCDSQVYNVPLDPRNSDYAILMQWVEEGGVIIDE